MTWGLTPAGFVRPTFDEILTDLQQRARQGDEFFDGLGALADLSRASPLGNSLAISALKISELWEALQATYDARRPDAAMALPLVELCAITGTIPRAATRSRAALVLTGDVNTEVLASSLLRVAGATQEFEISETVVLTAVAAWASGTPYAVGDRVQVGGVRVYQYTFAGTSGSDAPTSTAASISDGYATLTYLGEGSAATDAVALSSDVGPVLAPARTLTEIVTPIGGWASAINLLDAVPGLALERDDELRERREAELSSGARTLLSLRGAVSGLPGVTYVRTVENTSDEEDADGLPPHSVEVLVVGGEEEEIAAAIAAHRGEGIASHGSTTVEVTDSQGEIVEISFTRPEEIEIYLDVTIEIVAAEYPDDGDEQIKAALVAGWAALAAPGLDSRISRHVAAIDRARIPGVLGVADDGAALAIYQGTAPAPTSSATVAISLRQIAVLDTSRITVTTEEAAP